MESVKLSDVLGLIQKPRYVLGTTYSLSLAFFESVVLPSFGDPSALHGCLIICDGLGYRRALSEGAALLGAGQDYVVVPAPMSDAFHSKVWLVLGDEEAVLLVGSGNLTQAGFMTNAEIFEALRFSKDEPISESLLSSLQGFIKGLSAMWAAEDAEQLLCVELLEKITEGVGSLPRTEEESEPSIQFIHSFAGPLIGQLPEMPDARELSIAAPFFGNSLNGLNLLTGRYSKAKLSVFPAVHGGDATDLPLSKVKQHYKGAKVARLQVPHKKSAFAHLKLYGVAANSDDAWLCCTSANCTAAAWNGPNIEAGLVRPASRSLVSAYFVADKQELPTGTISYKGESDGSALQGISASDTGVGLDIYLLSSASARLPFRKTTVTVRAGSLLVTCRKETLFGEGRFAHIPWSSFEGWQRQRRTAICLEVDAVDAGNHPVHGSCFVENQELLRADPQHRRAYRGVLALLDSEGVPELSDIAAVLSLSKDLFEGTLIRLPAAETSGKKIAKESEHEGPASIAIWPPRADITELQRTMGRTGAGQLQWIQRILSTLLQNEQQAATGVVDHLAGIRDEDDEESSTESEAERREAEKRAVTQAERIWKTTHKELDWMRDRLGTLCPKESQAPNIWIGAIAVLLSCLAAYRTARRIAPDCDYGTNAHFIADDFLSLMLNERRQHEDFCCPKGFRYQNEVFPPLANDLRTTFKVTIHSDLTVVLLAMLTDKKLRTEEGLYHLMWKRLLGQVCEPSFQVNTDVRTSAYRKWRRLFGDEVDAISEEHFNKVFDALWALK